MHEKAYRNLFVKTLAFIEIGVVICQKSYLIQNKKWKKTSIVYTDVNARVSMPFDTP